MQLCMHHYAKENVNKITFRIIATTLRSDVLIPYVLRNMYILSLAAFPLCRLSLFFFNSHQILLHLYDMQLMSHRIIEIRNGKDALSHLVHPLTVQDCSLQCIFIFSNALNSPDLNVSRDRASTNSFRRLLHGPAALTLWKIFLYRTCTSFFSHFHFFSSSNPFYQLQWFPSSLLIFILYVIMPSPLILLT